MDFVRTKSWVGGSGPQNSRLPGTHKSKAAMPPDPGDRWAAERWAHAKGRPEGEEQQCPRQPGAGLLSGMPYATTCKAVIAAHYTCGTRSTRIKTQPASSMPTHKEGVFFDHVCIKKSQVRPFFLLGPQHIYNISAMLLAISTHQGGFANLKEIWLRKWSKKILAPLAQDLFAAF